MAKLLRLNQTAIDGFILLGFSDLCESQVLLFLSFLIIYIATITGNVLIVVTVLSQHRLHTPMYWFLSNLSYLEICYTTNIVPRMLLGFLLEKSIILFPVCMIQFYLFASLGTTECLLLGMMAYDRYLAICYPLHYAAVMTGRVCTQLAAGSWACGFLIPMITVSVVSHLTFCGPKEINHFFCDFKPLVKLSCMDSYSVETTVSILSSVVTLVPLLLILVSYTHILRAILRIPSTTGRQKAFSTCSSHLIVVTTFYGTLIVMYVAPSANDSPALNKVFSLLYTTVTPMFNPIIYSLRNQEVREGVKKLLRTMVLKGSKFKITLCK
ncbi:olfactory receptor 11A1-like [Gopherus evgoodei]|uniref:olfactory receptor 11A1-like n=1 Tax=Gopherus evgoodei TaxID=1825980 RepID=UPI0011D02394|nr:olfactory receptor 11A1-like [Gopherus evgoodei]